ncbi:MAG: PQQ-binding-like beta-propeller repeat protein [Candidatus Aegiribacteria sp.]|nr:PQQ-binding-like beta-propeller repeat protein [Candidatus Aegiribacteria sp.]
MSCVTLLVALLISNTSLTIIHPENGETYSDDRLDIRVIVENENELPDSVHYSLNGQSVVDIPRLNTDWYTYMANDNRTGYSESPAPHDNTILWTAPISGTYHEFVSPVIVNSRVYFASEEDEIAYCLSAATGEEIWRFENIGDEIDDAMHVKDNMVYLASDSIWCLDALTGAKIWSFGDSFSRFSGPPVPHNGRLFVDGNFVYSLDAATGDEIWKSSDTLLSVSSMTAWNGLLFVSVPVPRRWNEGSLYALDTSTGEIVWANKCGNIWDSSPVVADGTIYIGTMTGSLFAIDAATGTTVWESSQFTYIESTPAIHEGSILFGNLERSIYSVDRSNGDIQWEYEIPTGDYLHGSPGVADGLVFWGDCQRMTVDSIATIHAVDIRSGTEVWSYDTCGGFNGIQSSPAITDGVMYIAATDGNLYAFGTGLKYSYHDNIFVNAGTRELIVTAYYEGSAFAADTIRFKVIEPSY